MFKFPHHCHRTGDTKLLVLETIQNNTFSITTHILSTPAFVDVFGYPSMSRVGDVVGRGDFVYGNGIHFQGRVAVVKNRKTDVSRLGRFIRGRCDSLLWEAVRKV